MRNERNDTRRRKEVAAGRVQRVQTFNKEGRPRRKDARPNLRRLELQTRLRLSTKGRALLRHAGFVNGPRKSSGSEGHPGTRFAKLVVRQSVGKDPARATAEGP